MERRVLPPRPHVLHSATYRAATLLGTAYITVTEDEKGAPTEALINIAKAGSDTFALAEAMGRLVSLILRMPSPLSRRARAERIVRQLSHVGGAPQPVRALPDAVAATLADHLQLPEARARPDGLASENPDARAPGAGTVSRPQSAATGRLAAPVSARAERLKFLNLPRTDRTKGEGFVNELRPEVKQAAQNLGNALKNTPLLRAYAEAAAKMEADAQATALLDELQRVQSDIRVRQSQGGVTRADIASLRELQYRVQTHPTISAFLDAQQDAKAFMPEVNQEISQLLGIDFASVAAPASC
jgi:cell fate (sporulation/competence/biofilm development) regulator YlbF (YheA/YmcA/DUF963 family)